MKWFVAHWLIVLPFALNAQAPVWIWATGFTGSASVRMLDVASSSGNGCFTLGSISGDLFLPFDTLVSTSGAYFVAHVDTLGTVTWAAQFSAPVVSMHGLENDGLSCLVRFSDSTIVQGQVVNGSPEGVSALVVEFDNTGTLVNLVVIPGIIVTASSTSVPHMHHAPYAGIVLIDVVTDSTSVLGTVIHGPGRVLARVSSNGDLLWVQLIDAGGSEVPGVAHIDAIGRSLVCAPIDFSGALSSYAPNGAPEWQLLEVYYEIFDPPVLARAPAGSALLGLGHPSQAPIGAGTMLEVSHYGLDGIPLWYATTSETTSWYHGINSLDAVEGGASVVGGRYAGPITFGTIPVTSNGPNGFVGLVDSTGSWEWVESETSGNVFGFHTTPGAGTRIYTLGSTDTGASFGGHQVSTNMGNFTGFVACLGDVALGTSDIPPTNDLLCAWPNPVTQVLHVPLRTVGKMSARTLDAWGRCVDHRVGWLSPTSFDVTRLSPGAYLLSIGDQHIRFIKE